MANNNNNNKKERREANMCRILLKDPPTKVCSKRLKLERNQYSEVYSLVKMGACLKRSFTFLVEAVNLLKTKKLRKQIKSDDYTEKDNSNALK